MTFSSRQLATIAFVAACMLIAAAVCLFAPLRFALLAVLVVVAVCSAVVLVFLRKVLSAVYRLRDTTQSGASDEAHATGEAVQRELTAVTTRLDRFEQHLPERLASRIAFELAQRERSGTHTP